MQIGYSAPRPTPHPCVLSACYLGEHEEVIQRNECAKVIQ